MPKPLTQKEAEQKVQNYNNEYKLVSKYGPNNRCSVTLEHKCGCRYEVGSFKAFFEGKNKCPVCYPSQSNNGHSTKRISEDEVRRRFEAKFPDGEYQYISGYTTMDKPTATILHTKCGNTFPAAPKMILGVKETGCPICANKERGKHLREDNYLQRILDEAEDGNEYEWLDTYNNDNKELLRIKHLKCGNIYLVRPNSFQQGDRCSECSLTNNQSKDIIFIKNTFKENNIEFKTEISFNDLIYMHKLRFDLLVDNLIIEYDGIQHFRSTNTFFSEDNIIRDFIKNIWIQNQKDYSFLRIPPNLNHDELKDIINAIKDKKLTSTIINKYKLYAYNRKNQVLYNTYDYYTNVNENYFKDYGYLIKECLNKLD